MEPNNIYCMDCLEGMKKMADDLVDISVTSPPYNLGVSTRGNLYGGYHDDMTMDEYYIFIRDVLKEMIRVSKYYVFFNFQLLSTNKMAYLNIISEFRNNIKDIIIWHKKQFAPAIQPTCLGSAFEFIIVFTKKEMAKNRSFERAFFNNHEKGQLNGNVIYGDNMSCTNQTVIPDSDNKAAFPEYLVRYFVDKFTDKNDIILDPFMGTGTVAYVAKLAGRRYIGFDIDQKYIDAANERLSQATFKKFIPHSLKGF